MNVLVTGPAEFIGMHAARRLLERGDEVVGVDNLSDYYDVRGESYVQHVSAEAIARAIRRGFEATADTGAARRMGWMCQCVERLPTKGETAHCTACGKTYSIEGEACRAAG